MSKVTDTALYTVLNTDRLSAAAGSLGDLGVTGLFRRRKPAGVSAAEPYLIFFEQADTDVYTLKQRAFQRHPYFVECVDRGSSAQRAQNILARVDALLNDAALSISGRTTMYLRREQTIERDEEVSGVTYNRVGASYSWWSQ